MDQGKTAGATFDLYPLACFTPGQEGYATISDAYTNTSGGLIYIQAYSFAEDLILDRQVDIAFDRGWNCDYTQYAGDTAIHSLTIDTGSVVLQGNALSIGP